MSLSPKAQEGSFVGAAEVQQAMLSFCRDASRVVGLRVLGGLGGRATGASLSCVASASGWVGRLGYVTGHHAGGFWMMISKLL